MTSQVSRLKLRADAFVRAIIRLRLGVVQQLCTHPGPVADRPLCQDTQMGITDSKFWLQTVSQPWVRPGRLVSPQQPAQAKQSPTRRWQNLSPAEHIDASRSPRKLSAPLPQRQAAAPTAFASTDPLPGTKRGVYAAHQARPPSNDGAIMQPTMQTVDAPLPAAAHISASERSSDRDIPAGFARSAPGGKAHEPALGGPAAGDTAGSIMLSETPAAHDDHTTGVLGSAPLGSSAAPQPALWHGNTADVHASGATPHPMSDADVVNQASATVPAKAPQDVGSESVPYSPERALDTDLEQTVSVAAGDSSAAVHTALQSEDVSPKAHTNGLARPASETTQAHSSVGLKLAQWNLQAASAATTARSGVLSAAGDLSPIALAGHSSAASSHQLVRELRMPEARVRLARDERRCSKLLSRCTLQMGTAGAAHTARLIALTAPTRAAHCGARHVHCLLRRRRHLEQPRRRRPVSRRAPQRPCGRMPHGPCRRPHGGQGAQNARRVLGAAVHPRNWGAAAGILLARSVVLQRRRCVGPGPRCPAGFSMHRAARHGQPALRRSHLTSHPEHCLVCTVPGTLQDSSVMSACCKCAGFKELKVPYETSRIVMGAFDGLIKLLRTFARQGWFLHLAFMNDVKGRFDALHNCIVDALVAAGAAEVPTGKRLLPGDYSDPTRALRRCVRAVSCPNGIGMSLRASTSAVLPECADVFYCLSTLMSSSQRVCVRSAVCKHLLWRIKHPLYKSEACRSIASYEALDLSCRTLKQLGSGGIAAGVGVTARDPSAQVSVASVLAVPQHALGEELARLPRSAGASNADVDLGKMYERLCAIPQHAQHTDGSEEGGADKYRDVFEWYAAPNTIMRLCRDCTASCAVQLAREAHVDGASRGAGMTRAARATLTRETSALCCACSACSMASPTATSTSRRSSRSPAGAAPSGSRVRSSAPTTPRCSLRVRFNRQARTRHGARHRQGRMLAHCPLARLICFLQPSCENERTAPPHGRRAQASATRSAPRSASPARRISGRSSSPLPTLPATASPPPTWTEHILPSTAPTATSRAAARPALAGARSRARTSTSLLRA